MNIMMQQLGLLFLVRCWIFGIKPQRPRKRAAYMPSTPLLFFGFYAATTHGQLLSTNSGLIVVTSSRTEPRSMYVPHADHESRYMFCRRCLHECSIGLHRGLASSSPRPIQRGRRKLASCWVFGRCLCFVFLHLLLALIKLMIIARGYEKEYIYI
jgi:hypothetical protein